MAILDFIKKSDPAGCARSMKLIAKSDTVASVTGPHRGFFIEAESTLKIVTVSDDTITATFPAGYNPIMVKQVFSTGSDAVNVWGLI